MSSQNYKALVVEESSTKGYVRSIVEKHIDDLPNGEVLIRVHYSSLNYKDALSATGNKGVTRKYPHTPGIDAAGVIEESTHADFKPGDNVIVTSYDLGMNTAGGFGQYIRVPGDWVVPLPDGLTLRESMIYGTAGFTAGMSIQKLIDHDITPEKGEVLVTGATGGVGSLAVTILSGIGYKVVAVSGKPDAAIFLKKQGAVEVISREDAVDKSGRPLMNGRWAGVVDTVGGDYLSTAIKSAQPNAIVTCCGLVASPNVVISVFPFILRGVGLLGIDSQNCPMAFRQKVWQHLAGNWKPGSLDEIATEVSLDQLNTRIDLILKGELKGHTIVNLMKD